MTDFFGFEQDFIASLRCIPMIMRYKLDTCGVKMKLDHWHKLTEAEKTQLIQMSCETPAEVKFYHETLQGLITEKTGTPAKVLDIDPNPPWLQPEIPTQVLEKAQNCNVEITPAQWQHLTPLQRFALLKLSRPSHENHNFVPALKEFKVIT
ncbi:nitrate reductase associated protein [Picosynechococcus sp. PCC 73109]|uniref:nitrate reductase associated protein n=1 Tax=Picosynechococcus sp. PCC 73109 TaxID=374982 RepID=UPI0007457D8A|nr:nitrate reductase associated protein [Picosynechococcus sp. PCC 73109]AMA10397.1 nitrate reductase associated protein [Picosynechococcus sp. PCC 73109]